MKKLIILLMLITVFLAGCDGDFFRISETTPTGLSVTKNGEGTVDITFYGNEAVLEAQPADGWSFDRWSGDLSNNSRIIRVNLGEGDIEATANFVNNSEPGEGEPGGERDILELDGSGKHTTRPFEVEDSWEVQWEAEGQLFQIYLYDSSGNLENVLANQEGPGTGSAYVPEGGEYYLDINAMGDWTVKITQLN